MRFIGASGGMYSYDMSMKMWCTYFKTPCMICNRMTQWNACLPYSHEMWCMIKKMICMTHHWDNEMHDCALMGPFSHVERCIICTKGGEG